MNRVTAKLLTKVGACPSWVKKFEFIFPEDVPADNTGFRMTMEAGFGEVAPEWVGLFVEKPSLACMQFEHLRAYLWDVRGVSFRDSEFYYAKVTESIFDLCDMAGMKISFSSMRDSFLSCLPEEQPVIIRSSYFVRSEICRMDFSLTDMKGSRFLNCKFYDCSIENLQGIEFKDCSFYRCKISDEVKRTTRECSFYDDASS